MAGRVHPPEKLSAESQSLYKAMNTSNPLACALIGGAFVEKAVTSLLRKFFVNCETAKGILGENGFLGEFSRCSQVAYCLGLISKGALENLKSIGRVRNLFVHSHRLIDFGDEEVKVECWKLLLPRVDQRIATGNAQPSFAELIDEHPAGRFIVVTALMFNRLMLLAEDTEHRERVSSDILPDPKQQSRKS